MSAIARIALLGLVMGLSACAVQQPVAPRGPTIPPARPGQHPERVPAKPIPSQPKAIPRNSASFAPPPGGNSHWDGHLGVYVLDNQPNTFYRQRTYYRWNNGWSRAISPQGPWEDTDATGVPPGLGHQFAQ